MKEKAKRGEIILLYEDETVVWRFALPRAGWWYKKKRVRIDDLEETKSEIKKQEKKKREDWKRYRSWHHITCGVLLYVIGVVEYLTSKVIFKIVPHLNGQEFQQFLYQVLHHSKGSKKKIVMIVDRSGVHKAKRVDPFLEKHRDRFEFYFLPAHAGHHLNAIEGFWHPVKDAIGANRCIDKIRTLYQRTRTVLSRHQKEPIFHFKWH